MILRAFSSCSLDSRTLRGSVTVKKCLALPMKVPWSQRGSLMFMEVESSAAMLPAEEPTCERSSAHIVLVCVLSGRNSRLNSFQFPAMKSLGDAKSKSSVWHKKPHDENYPSIHSDISCTCPKITQTKNTPSRFTAWISKALFQHIVLLWKPLSPGSRRKIKNKKRLLAFLSLEVLQCIRN